MPNGFADTATAKANQAPRGMKRSLFSELKRRNVLRAATLYAAGAWLLTQIVTQVGPVFDLPPSTQRWLIAAAVIGFPFAITLSWFYELTPEGFKREGEVEVPETVRYSTGRKLDFSIIGLLSLAVVLLIADRFILREKADPSTTSGLGNSIAVLPFVNMSRDPANEYFSDGITEEILDALTQIRDLKVAARTSAFAFKGKAEDLRKVGETLGVTNVLEGSVQRVGDTVRITAQLIDVRSGFHLWSEKYDRQQANLFSVEDEISKAIADRLKVQFAGESALVTQKTGNPRAHDFYLRALAVMPNRGVALREAQANLEQAVALDPDYAEAWAALSFVHEMLPTYQLADWRSARQSADDAAHRAMAIDPHSAHAQAAHATLLRDDLKFAEADAGFRAALALSPGDSEIHDKYAQLLTVIGDDGHAVEQARLSAAQNPLGMHPHYLLGYIYENAHRYDEAVVELRRALELQPDFADSRFDLALVYLEMHNFRDAEEQVRTGAKLAGEDPELCATLVQAVANPALRPDAIKRIDVGGMCGRYDFYGVTPALWYSLFGAHDKAVESVLHATNSADPGELFWDLESLRAPGIDPIRDDPQYQAAMLRLGLPQQEKPQTKT